MSVSSDFKKAVEYHNLHLKRAKEVREMHGEGNAYGNLGNAYDSLGDFKKAIEYHNLHLEIAKEVGDNHGEGCAYGNLGTAHGSQGDFRRAINNRNLHLKIAQEVGDKRGEGGAYDPLSSVKDELLIIPDGPLWLPTYYLLHSMVVILNTRVNRSESDSPHR